MNDQMQLAKGRLGLYAGFWLALASKMQWVPDTKAPGGVAATDGRTVWYNPENINARPLGEAVFIALHEVGHPMLCHLTRRGERNYKIYGAAIDIVLNHLLTRVMRETPALGMVLPDDATIGSVYGFSDDEITSVEEVYEKLFKKCKESGGGGKDGKGIGDGMPEFDFHGMPTNEDGTPMTAKQIEASDKEWTITVRVAADMAKKMGKFPGYMEEFVTELLKPKVDWRSQLWAATKVAKDESSYRRFNRKFVHGGLYLPGQYSERIGAMGYFCDTSGSISSDEFKQAMGEMTYLLEELKPDKIYFGQCDTKLHSVDELTPDQLPLPAIKIHGRGGTNMKEAFEWACKHEDEIDLFVMQTDGEVPPLDMSLHPRCAVIVIKTTRAKLPEGWDFPVVIEVDV